MNGPCRMQIQCDRELLFYCLLSSPLNLFQNFSLHLCFFASIQQLNWKAFDFLLRKRINNILENEVSEKRVKTRSVAVFDIQWSAAYYGYLKKPANEYYMEMRLHRETSFLKWSVLGNKWKWKNIVDNTTMKKQKYILIWSKFICWVRTENVCILFPAAKWVI